MSIKPNAMARFFYIACLLASVTLSAKHTRLSLQKALDNMRSNKASSARDQDLHIPNLFILSSSATIRSSSRTSLAT